MQQYSNGQQQATTFPFSSQNFLLPIKSYNNCAISLEQNPVLFTSQVGLTPQNLLTLQEVNNISY